MEQTEYLVDSKLLNLPEHVFTTPPQLLQHLFSRWISLPCSSKLVKALTEYVADRNLTSLPRSSVNAGAVENSLVLNAISRAINRSPANASTSERNLALEHQTPASSSSTPLALAGDIKKHVIPQFYFPRGRQPTSELREDCLNRIDNLFGSKINGLDRNEFRKVTKEVCRLPFFLSSALFNKIVTDSSLKVTRDAFIQYWVHGNMLTLDKATQIFNVLKQPDRNYLTQADFLTALGELCAFHPGLAFLEGTPDTQESYASTVLFRIFYYINRSGNDRITLRELKRGDLVAAMQHADEEADINEVRRYFSYEHALIIYWKFLDLDTDDDLLIDKTELANYNNNALSNRILDRIFSQVPRRFKSKIEGKMCYEDFVYFILAEEDKQSEPSLEYWFRCIDLDGNGILTCDELKHFYEEQIDRMNCNDEEDYVPFELMLHRLFDMIAPEGKDSITWHDVKASKLSGDFFNILFNLNKFMASEWLKRRQDDLKILAGKKHLKGNLTEWDLFALREFHKFDMELVSDSDKNSSTTHGKSETYANSFDDKTNPKKKLKAIAPY